MNEFSTKKYPSGSPPRRTTFHSRSLPRTNSPGPQRGSVLTTALIFAAILAIGIATYLKLSTTSIGLANRSLFSNVAMNVTETGLEQAIWSFNQATSGNSAAWTGWTLSGNNATRTFSGFAFPQNTTGVVKVYIKDYNATGSTQPLLVAKGIITPADGPTIIKMVEVILKRRSLFATGLVAKNTISFSGNTASVDSWNSDPDNNSGTAAIPYSSSVKHDSGSVGSISVSVNAVLVDNADIWGYASTGGSLPSVGSQGIVGPFGTASGTMDMSHVSTDFTANFDPVTAPTTTGYTIPAITTDTTLPRVGVGDLPAADGKYYYSSPQINFSNHVVTISNKVVLVLTDPLTGIDISGGSGEIHINSASSLEVYTAGDIKIGGLGLNSGTTNATASQPINCQIWGTKTSGTQDIQIIGNGVLSAVVYAPQGSVKINGNGDVSGAVIANDITMVGNALFHYDESLANFSANNPFGITKWRELTTAADRDYYASQLNF